jgi:lysophospholipase L1-like esterase
LPQRTVNVINAGIEGYDLDDMSRLAQHKLARLGTQAVLVYPGFNDMSGLCRSGRASAALQPLPAPALPGWALTADLVAKNTTALRMHQGRRSTVSADELAAYRHSVEQLVQRLRSTGLQPVLMTVSRSFDGQPREQQAHLAQTALYYNACLDLDGLLAAGQGFNEQIRQVAQAQQLPVVDLASQMPGGDRYFVDASHFNAEGDRKAAELVMRALEQDAALAPLLSACAVGATSATSATSAASAASVSGAAGDVVAEGPACR